MSDLEGKANSEYKIESNEVSLTEVIDHINGDKLKWAILSIWATGHLDKGESVIDFEEKVMASPFGLHVTWSELVSLASQFDQINDVVIIGSKNADNLRRYETDSEMYSSCEIVIEMNDSTYWSVHVKDHLLVKEETDLFLFK